MIPLSKKLYTRQGALAQGRTSLAHWLGQPGPALPHAPQALVALWAQSEGQTKATKEHQVAAARACCQLPPKNFAGSARLRIYIPKAQRPCQKFVIINECMNQAHINSQIRVVIVWAVRQQYEGGSIKISRIEVKQILQVDISTSNNSHCGYCNWCTMFRGTL